MKAKNRNYKLSFFLYFLVFGLLIELITVGIVYTLNYYEMLEQLRSEYKVESVIKKNLLKNLTNGVENSINSILQNQIFTRYLQDSSTTNKELVQNLFYFISKANSSYMQVRYLDKEGMERIRVDKSYNDSLIIKDDDLQNKADRYYFQDTIKTNSKNFWYSNLDLNIERGKIEVPYKPTLRIAKQVVYENQSRGVVIINISMQGLLERLVRSSNFNIDLVDKEGYYIYSYNTKNSWSADLKSGKNIKNILDIKTLKVGEFEEDNTFFVQIDAVMPIPQKPYLVFAEKREIVQNLQKQNFYVTLWIVFIVLVVSIPIAFFISSIPLTLQGKLRDALEQLQSFSRIVDKYVMTLVLDAKQDIKSASTAFCEKGLYDKKELVGKNYSLIVQKNTTKEIDNSRDDDTDFKSRDMVFTTKDGSFVYVEQTATVTSLKQDEKSEYTIILSDITEKKEMERRSITDPLTKLFNRAGIDQFLAREVELSRRHKNSLSVIIIDIDFFKKVNDIYGHQVGDIILVELSGILKAHIRSTDLAGRFGGEEFMLILPQTNQEGGLIVAEELRKKIEAYNFSAPTNVTASLGVASFDGKEDIHSLIKRADKALYKAKESGRNRVCF